MSTPESHILYQPQNAAAFRFDHTPAHSQQQWWQRRMARLDTRRQGVGTETFYSNRGVRHTNRPP